MVIILGRRFVKASTCASRWSRRIALPAPFSLFLRTNENHLQKACHPLRRVYSKPVYLDTRIATLSPQPLVAGLGVVLVLSSLFMVATTTAQPVFEKHSVDSTFTGAHAVQAYDLDQDGDMDFIGAGVSVGQISWWENEAGNGLVWKEHIVAEMYTGARFIDAADLDADGDLDLFGAAASLDAITWWENAADDASVWIPHTVDSTFDFAMHVHAADIDGDEDLDLLGAALKGDEITWWENTDGVAMTWEKHTIADEFDGARHVCAIDIDGDGDADLLGSADIANTVKWWENVDAEGGEWRGFVVDSTFEGVNGVVPGDLDQDGDPDLIGAADIADDIVWWEHVEGDSIEWVKNIIDPAFDGAFSVIPADMDNDGDLDILGAAAEADVVVWWENMLDIDGDWIEHAVDEAFSYPVHVNVADMDGDGDADVLGGGFEGEVVWWANPLIETTLPVELTHFEIVIDLEEIILNWSTASETNNAGFEVQHRVVRSDRRQHASELKTGWQTISFVNGAGTSTTARSYSYSLVDVLPGRHRFRLKQVDFDGTFSYSETVEIQINVNGAHDMSDVYPNPFNPQARFYLSLSIPQEVRIDVYNALGQRVLRLYDGLLAANEAHEFDFDANDLPGGLYMIHAFGETFATTKKAMLVK